MGRERRSGKTLKGHRSAGRTASLLRAAPSDLWRKAVGGATDCALLRRLEAPCATEDVIEISLELFGAGVESGAATPQEQSKVLLSSCHTISRRAVVSSQSRWAQSRKSSSRLEHIRKVVAAREPERAVHLRGHVVVHVLLSEHLMVRNGVRGGARGRRHRSDKVKAAEGDQLLDAASLNRPGTAGAAPGAGSAGAISGPRQGAAPW